MDQKKIYRVGIIISNPDSFLNLNNEPRGIMIDIWNFVENQLKGKYKFERIILKDNYNFSWKKSLENISKKKIDILIGSIWKTPERSKNFLFSKPLFLTSPIIIYDNRVESKINIKKFIIHILKSWIIPVIFIFIFSLIVSYFYKRISKHNLIDIFYIIIISFFGNKNLFNDIKGVSIKEMIIRSFVLMFVFFIYLYILSQTLKKTTDFYKKSNILQTDIKGKTFYVEKGSYSTEILKKYGAKSIEVLNAHQKYSYNKYKKKISGFVFDNIDLNPIIINNQYFTMSSVIQEYFPVCFICSKEYPYIMDNIDKILNKLILTGNIYKFYNKKINNEIIIC